MPFRTNRIEPLVEAATERARSRGRDVLVSVSERVDALDPVGALESLMRRLGGKSTSQARLSRRSMYWERPGESFALAGIGAAATLEYSSADRFALARRDWHALLDGALVDGDDAALGSGPILMGGFAFEPEGPRTPRWAGFPGARLMLPRVLFSSVEGECSLTLNLLVSPAGMSDVDLPEIPDFGTLPDPVAVRAGTSDFNAGSGDGEVTVSSLSPRGEWQETVRAAVKEIREGGLDKVVLARAVRITASEEIDIFALLRNLRRSQRESVVFAIFGDDRAFVGATPERLVRLRGRSVEASSLAGTIERGSTLAEDAANASQLRESAKDLAEHAAVRDELYSSLAETCDDVNAAETPSVLTLPHVHHLHTSLRARLRDGGSLLDLVAQLHPTPAVGGLPRERALRFITQHENLDRGWYAAPVGWLGREGGEFAVALRSALVEANEAVLFAGCGIVGDSDPDLEYAESNLKLQAMQSAIAASVLNEAANADMSVATERSA